MSHPTPATMLLEGAIDTVASLKLLRLCAMEGVPFGEALEVINAAIAELEYAISAALDEKVQAA